jgi:rRNA maturation endonuclease Nob1
MLVKYEVEKKKEKIDRLAEQNKTTKRTLMLTTSLVVTLLIILLVFILLHKFRKKNLEQSIYESALLAELKQSELEQNLKEKERLLEQKPTKTMIGKLSEWILKSVMVEAKKNAYIQQLSELDIDMLEQGYFTATEKISNMDMKYIICFAIDMDTKDMSILFNVEHASIHTVRYRIKKKFREKNTFKFLM